MSLFFSTGSFIARSPSVAADDDYALLVAGLGGLVAHWRLGDPGAGTLADVSGNDHHGSYDGDPTFQAADLTLAWQGSDGRAVDFAASGHGSVAHDAAFALPQGSLGFWFELNTLASEQGLLGKDQSGATSPDDQMAVRVKTDGSLNCYFQRGGSGTDLTTIPGAIAAGERHHVVVTWSEKIVRLWLDGRQVAKSEGHTTGLAGNDLPWRFGIRTYDDALADVRLDEVALFDRALLFDDVQALSQHLAGMGYRDADALRVVNVGSGGELDTALSNAQPGDHIVLADGTYTSGSSWFTADVDGTRADPIVIRSANGAANCTFDDRVFLNGDWTILDGVGMEPDRYPEIFGKHVRVTRCVNGSVQGLYGVVIRPGAWFSRVDHCEIGPLEKDSGGSESTNQCIRIRTDGTDDSEQAKYALIDHNRLIGAASELGNGRDMLSVGNTPAADAYVTVHCNHMRNGAFDEGISLKASSNFVQHCTFDNINYVQTRNGADNEFRSNHHTATGQRDNGKNNWMIGLTLATAGDHLGLMPGDTLQDAYEADSNSGGRPASESAMLIGITFLNGNEVTAGEPVSSGGSGTRSRGAEAEGCTNWSVTYTNYIGTITHLSTTGEPFEVAAALAPSDVGPAAGDPLVPPGWK